MKRKPTVAQLKKKAFKLWGQVVRKRDHDRCRVCGKLPPQDAAGAA